MSLLGPNLSTYVRLLSRNEAKLKSYDSCIDVRAWSHDEQTRSEHLREWIKCDMPICVLPVCTLASLLRVMTCRSRARTIPRCHRDCKSKIIIDSLCNSCRAINDCLKSNQNLDKYFAEDELETSHWPCDRCLEVLRSIKMFWKIIIEKIFCINLSKTEEFDNIDSDYTNSVKSLAKMWEREIVEQAMFVKSITPLFGQNMNRSSTIWGKTPIRKGIPTRKEIPIRKESPIRKDTVTRIPRPTKTVSKDSSFSKVKSPTRSIVSQKSRMSDLGRSSFSLSKNSNRMSYKIHRSTSVRLKTKDVACSCELDKNNEEVLSYKQNVAYLQQKCNSQETEIEKLQRENISLKYELQNVHKTSYDLTTRHTLVDVLSNCDITAIIPKPFESSVKDGANRNIFSNVDSEMIITMKNCRREVVNPPERFQHVSVLQILHKTNEPLNDEELPNSSYKKQNPIELLTKVRKTFGEIVKREIKIVSSTKQVDNHDIEATFCKINGRSAPSCSSPCSDTASSELKFEDV